MPYKDREKQLAYQREHYHRNKDTYNDRSHAYRRENRKKIREFILERKSTPCVDCSVQYPPYVMDFDHINGDKECNVADLVKRSVSFEKVQEEVDKCEVVCANCHRIRTHGSSL